MMAKMADTCGDESRSAVICGCVCVCVCVCMCVCCSESCYEDQKDFYNFSNEYFALYGSVEF